MSRPMMFSSLLFIGIFHVINSQQQFTTNTTNCCDNYCFTSDDNGRNQIKQFGALTSYVVVKGQNSDPLYNVPNCEPTKFWITVRHGARLPPARNLAKLRDLADLRDDIVKNYDQRRSKPDRGPLCDRDLDLLKAWRWNTNITENYDQYLVVQGWNDVKYIAVNYQHAFSRLLNSIYTPEEYFFQNTDLQRTIASNKAFLEGLFGEDAYDHIVVAKPPAKDYILRPYDQCPAWIKNKASINEPTSEVMKFKALPIFRDLVNDVSVRLGFRYPLTADQVWSMWDLCRFEQSWNILTLSPWCVVFTPKQVEVLEYAEDLKEFHRGGYGYPPNEQLPCHLIQDVFAKLKNNTSNPKVTAYFTHSSTILTFLAGLGAFKDRNLLRADNFEQMKRRYWKSSQLSPFSANVAIVKYDCPNERERDKVTFFINERPLDLSWCNTNLCDWSKFEENYRKFLDADCSKTFCAESGANLKTISVVLLFIAQYFLWK